MDKSPYHRPLHHMIHIPIDSLDWQQVSWQKFHFGTKGCRQHAISGMEWGCRAFECTRHTTLRHHVHTFWSLASRRQSLQVLKMLCSWKCIREVDFPDRLMKLWPLSWSFWMQAIETHFLEKQRKPQGNKVINTISCNQRNWINRDSGCIWQQSGCISNWCPTCK